MFALLNLCLISSIDDICVIFLLSTFELPFDGLSWLGTSGSLETIGIDSFNSRRHGE